MKKCFVFALALLMGCMLYAQEDGRRDMRRQQREFSPEQAAAQLTERLNQAVGLDSVQYQIVYLMNYSDMLAQQDSMKVRRARYEEMRKSGKQMERKRPTEEQLKAYREVAEQRKAVRDAQMKELLSPEQYEKYLKYEEESNKRRRGMGGRGGRGARGNRGGDR